MNYEAVGADNGTQVPKQPNRESSTPTGCRLNGGMKSVLGLTAWINWLWQCPIPRQHEGWYWVGLFKRTVQGFKNIAEIDVGLRTRIHGIKEKFANEEFANRLNDLFDENIICPPEGDIPPLLENRIYSAIKTLGHEWLWVADEFGTERKLTWIDDLIEKDLVSSHGCVFTHDHSLLITTHWDSHCSFLCSSKDIIEKILSVDNFEGFYCSPKTEVYWGLYEV